MPTELSAEARQWFQKAHLPGWLNYLPTDSLTVKERSAWYHHARIALESRLGYEINYDPDNEGFEGWEWIPHGLGEPTGDSFYRYTDSCEAAIEAACQHAWEHRDEC